MLFTLEAIPAKEGDCLLLHWGRASAPKLALIDAGPGGVFKDHLAPRLSQYRQRSGKSTVTFELVMVSHIDADHITGINALVAQARADAEASGPRRWRLKRLWHNTFNDTLGDRLDAHYRHFTAGFLASADGAPRPAVVDGLRERLAQDQGLADDEARHVAHDIAAVLASHAQGRTLRIDHDWLHDQGLTGALNDPAVDGHGRPTLVTSDLAAPIRLNGLELTVVGPMGAEIRALQAEFDKFLKKSGLSAEAALAAYADKSIPNLSSIVALVRAGSGDAVRSILLTGDARGDKVIGGLRQAGLLDTQGNIEVDVLKVPHHGSDRNVSPDFFRAVRASEYILSGNGLHGNPDTSTLRWIAEARGKGDDYRVALTYAPESIDAVHRADRAQDGKAFDPERHSLVRELKRLRAEGYRFRLHAGGGHRVVLGDEDAPW
jgi:hypothetical protein